MYIGARCASEFSQMNERKRIGNVHVKSSPWQATFDGPARAIHAARNIRAALRSLQLDIRAGIHTGEIELADDDLVGIAVHLAQRVCALAGAGEVWVSSTVVDLVVGSGIEFRDCGEHELKGVSGLRRLYAVAE